MGLDIYGAIECRPVFEYGDAIPAKWEYSIDLSQLNGKRNYDAFGCLFGIRNFAGFEPLAEDRGLPDDVADRTREECERYSAIGTTWISWSELANVDWDEAALRPDPRTHEYRGERLRRGDAVRPDGEWQPVWTIMRTLAHLHGSDKCSPRRVVRTLSRTASADRHQTSSARASGRPHPVEHLGAQIPVGGPVVVDEPHVVSVSAPDGEGRQRAVVGYTVS